MSFPHTRPLVTFMLSHLSRPSEFFSMCILKSDSVPNISKVFNVAWSELVVPSKMCVVSSAN